MGTEHATLVAVARHLAPAGADADVLATRVEERLARAPEALREELSRGLAVFGSAPAAMLSGAGFSGFAALSPEAQRTMLLRWEDSPIPSMRTLFQALRRLVLGAHYADPSAARAVGYLPPLTEEGRAPLPWEGPDADAPQDGPVARAWTSGGASPLLRAGDALPARVEVVIVGSGAGGAMAAARLAEAGREVLLLEEGPWVDEATLVDDEVTQTERLYADGGLRATEDLAVTVLQGACAGGGTTVNWMMMLRTPAHVREEWRRAHGVAIPDSEWERLFAQIEDEVHAREVPDDLHSANNQLLRAGARALGWSTATSRVNARGCVRAGTCGIGCRHGAKQGGLRTFLPRARAAGARVACEARAVRIERREPGRRGCKRVHVEVRGADGAWRPCVVDATTVVLAGGAVGTAALLTRSGMASGAVGRHLRLHPTTAVLGRYPHEVHPGTGMPMTVTVDAFLDKGAGGYGFWVQCPPMLPVLGAVAAPGWGDAHAAIMGGYRHLGAFLGLVRDGADGDTGSVEVDSRGRVRLRYAPGPRDTENLIDAMAAAARLHLAAGAAEVFTLHNQPVRARTPAEVSRIRDAGWSPNRCGLFSAHVNGTCRIGTDPLRGGVNPEGERWGEPGVWVVDGSLLPTGVGANPQETILALGTWVVERILQA